jgi:hypothetical protein
MSSTEDDDSTPTTADCSTTNNYDYLHVSVPFTYYCPDPDPRCCTYVTPHGVVALRPSRTGGTESMSESVGRGRVRDRRPYIASLTTQATDLTQLASSPGTPVANYRPRLGAANSSRQQPNAASSQHNAAAAAAEYAGATTTATWQPTEDTQQRQLAVAVPVACPKLIGTLATGRRTSPTFGPFLCHGDQILRRKATLPQVSSFAGIRQIFTIFRSKTSRFVAETSMNHPKTIRTGHHDHG